MNSTIRQLDISDPSESLAGTGLSLTFVDSDAPAELLDVFVDEPDRIEEEDCASTLQEDVDIETLEGIPVEELRAGWGDQSAPTEPSVAHQPKKVLSWVSPLPDFIDVPETNRVVVEGQTFPFPYRIPLRDPQG